MEQELIINILEELRISNEALLIMSMGDSPNIIGAIDSSIENKYAYSYPVVQLSKNLAQRLVEINLPWKTY